MFSHNLLFRRTSGVLTTWAVDPEFGITFKVDVPGDAWFRRARGPHNQNVAEKCFLPGFAHLGIHVVLPG